MYIRPSKPPQLADTHCKFGEQNEPSCITQPPEELEGEGEGVGDIQENA